ncbi:hypothetical protein ACHAPA_011988 [Fusarium lateritium]
MTSIRHLLHGLFSLSLLFSVNAAILPSSTRHATVAPSPRERLNLNSGWKFFRSEINPDGLIYDHRPDLENLTDVTILKPWILPSANQFILNPAQHYVRPEGNPGENVSYVKNDLDDADWEDITLPHDWAIRGPFYSESDEVAPIDSRMGRLPVHGVGWYRRKLQVTDEDEGKQLYLDIDGAMSYAIVWINGKLVGGWPYGYNSFRLDLTPYVRYGEENQLAIRLDNPPLSSRWYPGAGIYRSVWLTKTSRTHIGQYGTFIRSRDVSTQSATLNLTVEVDNTESDRTEVYVTSAVHEYARGRLGEKIAEFPRLALQVGASGAKEVASNSVQVKNPKLWGPPPSQKPHLYVVVTNLYDKHDKLLDRYETQFGIRSVKFTANDGILLNGERIQIQGVNEHHDLGAIGTAFNTRAVMRKLEILKEMGVNAIRLSHNPPAQELLDLTDKLGFLIIDEIFDCWATAKRLNDFHLIFADWSEPDLRSFLRRDRNHASVIAWSFGNEVREQRNDTTAPSVWPLRDIVHEEDTTRPGTVALSHTRPGTPGKALMDASDVLNINYQGAGISWGANYEQVQDAASYTPPAYPLFHATYPNKLILGSETASALSSRGVYFFPVSALSAPVNDSSGGNEALAQVSAYELYTADAGSSGDKVFASQDANPYVAGEFVWTGFDYLGESTPYSTARSSYFGILDLAGFKKDRFYIYQARWRPDLPMAHLLPHWTWPNRQGKVTPVHVFTSGNEAELFLNNKSLGRKRRSANEYRLRWDDVIYTPGELRVVAYKNGTKWAEDRVRTAGEPATVRLTADRSGLEGTEDLAFVTAEIVDAEGNLVPEASQSIRFSVHGPAEIIATDNGDATSLVSFASLERKAFSGKALAVVRPQRLGKQIRPGSARIAVVAEVDGLSKGVAVIIVKF